MILVHRKEVMARGVSPMIGFWTVLRSQAHCHESIPVLMTISGSIVCQLMSVIAR